MPTTPRTDLERAPDQERIAATDPGLWDHATGITTGLAALVVATVISSQLGLHPVAAVAVGALVGGLIALLSAYRPLHEPDAGAVEQALREQRG